MSKNKAELLQEAQSRGLDVNEEMTNAELEQVLADNPAPDNADANSENADAAPQNQSAGVVSNQVPGDPVNASSVANKPEYGNATPDNDGNFDEDLDDGDENK